MVDVDVNMVKVECSNDEKKNGMRRGNQCVVTLTLPNPFPPFPRPDIFDSW